jgi:aspartokinase-like uncharacterized kinase
MVKLDAIIKIGGSLLNESKFYKLCEYVSKLSKKYKIGIVPGGSKFADLVRKLDKKIHFPSEVSHHMAILAMDQYGLLLSMLIKAEITNSLKLPTNIKKPVIFLLSKYFFEKDPLPNSWDVTSDSIAAYVAKKLKVKKLILVKNVDGIYAQYTKNSKKRKLIKKLKPKQLIGKKTCVDNYLPKFLLKNPLTVYIVNGKHPERIKEALEGKLSKGTIIK